MRTIKTASSLVSGISLALVVNVHASTPEADRAIAGAIANTSAALKTTRILRTERESGNRNIANREECRIDELMWKGHAPPREKRPRKKYRKYYLEELKKLHVDLLNELNAYRSKFRNARCLKANK